MTEKSALSANARGDPTIEPLLLTVKTAVTVKTAAAVLGISVPSVYREVGRGRLAMVKDGDLVARIRKIDGGIAEPNQRLTGPAICASVAIAQKILGIGRI